MISQARAAQIARSLRIQPEDVYSVLDAAKPAPLILARAETRSFTWTAVAETEAECEALLKRAYDAHVDAQSTYPHADLISPTLMRDLIEDGEVTFTPITAGVARRDDTILIQP